MDPPRRPLWKRLFCLVGLHPWHYDGEFRSCPWCRAAEVFESDDAGGFAGGCWVQTDRPPRGP